MTAFLDEVLIHVRSGDGGNGIVAWRREKYEPLGGPAGGNGGRGGNVYLLASSNLSTLIDFHYQSTYEAKAGERGGPKSMHGRAGKDLVIKVPLGTVVKDLESNQIVADLTTENQQVLIAEGGKGGKGNVSLASPTRRAPNYCEPGQAGIERTLKLELKLLADIGIIGLPNAGKSTLLSVLTNARPKIADYPFSTLSPNLGVIKGSDCSYVLADIPGLIEGASQGLGLGFNFLRHIERTRLLLHLVDINSEDITADIKTINKELISYSKDLKSLPRILVFTKTDTMTADENEQLVNELKKALPKVMEKSASELLAIFSISSVSNSGLNNLKNFLLEHLPELPSPLSKQLEVVEDVKSQEHPGDDFSIFRKKRSFYISGDRVERLLSVTNLREPESVSHFVKKLKNMGVIDALITEGAVAGSEVIIGKTAFTFGEEFGG